MADEIIEELWTIKDAMARELGHDVSKLVARLQGRDLDGASSAEDRPTVDVVGGRPPAACSGPEMISGPSTSPG